MEITSFGDDWYSLYSGGRDLEYLPVNPYSDLQDERLPKARVYCSGDFVIAHIIGFTVKPFRFTNDDYDLVMTKAIAFVEHHFKTQLKQVDIFGESS
jgi:hypothetical protein